MDEAVNLNSKEAIDKLLLETNRAIDRLLLGLKDLKAENGRLKDEARSAYIAGAKDLLLYLRLSCIKWDDDTYGEIDDRGVAHGSTTHTVVFDDGVLEEMLGLAEIKGPPDEYAIDRLRRAAETAMAEEAKPPKGA